MTVNILSLDYLIVDIIAEVEGNDRLSALAQELNLEPGSKGKLEQGDFDRISAAVAGSPVVMAPGGSAANTLWTVGKILGDKVDIKFIGVKGSGVYSSMIDASLREANIQLVPKKFQTPKEDGVVPQTTVSYVIKFPDGGRAIVTHPGNADKLITPEIITDDLVAGTDIVFIQGSLYRKFDDDVPDALIEKALVAGAKMWFALPTHGWFINENREMLRNQIKHAAVILGNEDELMEVYGVDDLEAATKELINNLQDDALAFITRGEDGVSVVSEKGVIEVASLDVAEIVNTLGAGDTAYAGFMVGQICGLSQSDTTLLGLTLAKANLAVDAARIPDPKSVITKELPSLI